jgi:glyoxylase-like metal-dependent hydrolase (beta-lactamase superfamily II)
MTMLTRRALFTGAAAVAAAAPLAARLPAHAAAPPAGTQAPGWYRYKVGSFEVTVVTDGMGRFKVPDNFVGNASKEDVGKALEAVHLDKDTMATPYNPIVVNTGAKLVLIDTGTGEAAFTSTKGATGQLLTNLAAAGIDPKAIDAVIISHYHGDHVNGLLRADNSLAFPNAEILVPAGEHAFWMDDGQMSRAPKGRMEDLFKNNRRVFAGEVMKRLRTYDEGLRPGRRHPCAVPVRAQSRLACVLRPGSHHRGGDPPQGLRHAGGGEYAGAGLPLSVPLGRLCREERNGLSRNRGAVESGDLSIREYTTTTWDWAPGPNAS